MSRKLSTIFFILMLIFIFKINHLFAQYKNIYGSVIDSATKETLPTAIIYIDGTNVSTTVDFDGNYTLKVPENYKTVTVVCKYLLYKDQQIKVDLSSVDSIYLPIKMIPENAKVLNEVTVFTEKKQDNNAGLVLMQKENKSLSDGISSETIKKTADKTTSDVLKRVSGVSVVGNKFVIIRGLNERYNLSWLNNAPLPSTEADKRAFSFNLIPSNVIDNIIINKTATADMPADFVGGSILINTKSIPDKNFFTVSVSSAYNTLATNKDFSNYEASKYHWLGIYDQSQNLPNEIPENPKDWITNDQQAAMAKNMKNDFVFEKKKILTNIGIQITGGVVKNLKNDQKIGFIFAQNYSNGYNKFNIYRTNYSNNANNDGDIQLEDSYTNTNTQNNVLNTSLFNAEYKFNNNHKINIKNLLVLLSNKAFIESYGTNTPLDSNRTVNKISTGFYTHSKIYSSQLNVHNNIEKIKLKSNITFGYSNITNVSPNVRYMSYSKFLRIQNFPDPSEPPPPFIKDTMYAANIGYSTTGPDYAGYRFYSKMSEDIRSIKWDVDKSIHINKVDLNLQTGFYFQQRQRTFDIRQFGYAKYQKMGYFFQDSLLYLSPEQIFDSNNMGLIDASHTGFKLIEITKPSDKYAAWSNNYAYYFMTTLEWKKLKLITGARYEIYQQKLTARRNYSDSVKINDNYKNLLPSVNAIFNINDKNAIRFCYSQTLNRPEFRELAPINWYNPTNRLVYYGNDTLLPAQVYNYDLRYEVYPGRGQLFTITPFYKFFIKPIEQVMSSGYTDEITWANAINGKVYGIETEFRIQLSSIFHPKKDSSILERFTVFTNVAYIKSLVKLDEKIHSANNVRPMQGQSPYLINSGVTYTDSKNHLSISILYNKIGQRIIFAGNVNDPDRYETGRHIIDFQIAKAFLKEKLEIRFNIQDILRQNVYIYQNTDSDTKYNKNKDYVFLKITYPTIYQFNVIYKF